MGKIDTSEWKEFRIGDYFKVEYGRFHAKDELGTGTVNYITTSGFNNGITNTCEEATHQGNCITVASDGAMGASFYQEEAFTTSNIVSTLTPLPHTPLNKYNALFLCAIIFGKRAEFGWLGFKMSVDRVRNLRVKLPATPDGAPDWAYMESYMANLETKVAESLTLLQAAKDAEKKKVDTREWGEFRVEKLFEKINLRFLPNRTFDKASDISETKSEEFDLPLVNAKHSNNGIMYYGRKHEWEYEVLTIDIVADGAASTGDVYAQPQETGVLYNAYLVKPKAKCVTGLILFFLSTVIQRCVKDHFGYDNKCTWDKVKHETILLPVDMTGQPDWAYMEEYMRKVKERVKVTMEKYEMTVNEVAL